MMSKAPEGKLITVSENRATLAKEHEATIGYPLTTVIFAWIVANAAEEERKEGKKDITPYWWTLKTGGVINARYTGWVKA